MNFFASRGFRHAARSLLLGLLLISGCDQSGRPAAPATAPSTPAEQTATLTIIPRESESWTPEQAVALLADHQDGLSAAVRLVRLSGLEPLCVPAGMADATASRLRLVALSDSFWALGLQDLRREQVLHAPVLINGEGAVFGVTEGTEEELLTLHVAEDSDVFPHLLISPRRVWIVQGASEIALTLEAPDCVGFCWRQERGLPYVALIGEQVRNFAEVARYLWEPYELAFTGPAMDSLPDPPGGKFQLDMPNSPKLIPIGGEIPQPKPTPTEPPQRIGGDVAAAPHTVPPRS